MSVLEPVADRAAGASAAQRVAGASRIALSLISHTNAGKTTLARTLLGRDVGEVRDAAHVTLEATAYTMIETPAGDRLELWDTPGFGDSVRLARRLRQQGNPIGWFLTQVWDRFRDRPLWLSQQAVRNVRDHADVVLYLVNAAEDPRDAGYLAPELEVLRWIGKPVLMLLNQTGAARPRADEAAEEARWREAVAANAPVRSVMTLDAFARCWVQETTLLRAVTALLEDSQRDVMHRLASLWQARRMEQFAASMHALAGPIAESARDRTVLAPRTSAATWRDVGRMVGLDTQPNPAESEAVRELAQRLEARLRTATEALIAVNGLEGRATGDILARVAATVTTEAPTDERKAAMLGGIVSGALSGLIADLAAGGLTLGAGMIAGGVLGALGGAGLARGYNIARGRTDSVVRWSDEFLTGLVEDALLRYLAVAHYGRGRGEWRESEYPVFWRSLVAEHLAPRKEALRARLGCVARHRRRVGGRCAARGAGPRACPRAPRGAVSGCAGVRVTAQDCASHTAPRRRDRGRPVPRFSSETPAPPAPPARA